MAIQAGLVVIYVPSNFIMLLTGTALLMAIRATENGIVFRSRVTFRATVPFPVMLSGIDRENSIMLGVICWFPPRCSSMAKGTIGWKSYAGVIWIFCIIIIRLVTGNTFRGNI